MVNSIKLESNNDIKTDKILFINSSLYFLLLLSINLLLDFLANGEFSIRVVFSSKVEILLSLLIPIPAILGGYLLTGRKDKDI